jgi:hypothetical protein
MCFIAMNKYGDAREALLEELLHYPDNNQAEELLRQVREEEKKRQHTQIIIPEDVEFRELLEQIRPYSMLPEARLYTLYALAKQVCLQDVPGVFVECGVAGGGSTALLAKIIRRYSRRPRVLFACDSYDGMPEPSESDRLDGVPADETGWGTGTCAAPEESVRKISDKLGVAEIVVPVKGYFENSLPELVKEIDQIALLHADCDWYESMLTVLEQLYDKINPAGVVQVDDYGYWEGIKKALDEFALKRDISFRLNNIDNMSAWFVKSQ